MVYVMLLCSKNMFVVFLGIYMYATPMLFSLFLLHIEVTHTYTHMTQETSLSEACMHGVQVKVKASVQSLALEVNGIEITPIKV